MNYDERILKLEELMDRHRTIAMTQAAAIIMLGLAVLILSTKIIFM